MIAMDYSKFINHSTEWEEVQLSPEEVVDEDIVAKMLLAKAIINLFMMAVFVIGVPLNLMVCVIVWKQRIINSSLRIVLLSLAIADLFVIFNFTAITLTHEIYDEWIFGSVICTFEIYSICLSQSFEAMMLATAFVAFLLEPKISSRSAWIIVVLLFIISMIMAIPRGFYAIVVEYDEHSICVVDFDADNFSLVLSQLIKLFLPWVTLIIFCIISNYQKIAETKLKRMKVNRISFVIFIVFLLLSSPFAVIKVLTDLKINISHLFLTTAQLMSLLTLIYKPFVYILLDKDFQKEIAANKNFRLKEKQEKSLTLSKNQQLL